MISDTGKNGLTVNGRTAKGRFGVGNPGGPGRPRRAVETEYLATLNDAVSIDDWREVVQRALADAKAGDSKARDWLTKHLMEGTRQPLLHLAISDRLGSTVDNKVESIAKSHDFRKWVYGDKDGDD